jgi:hypothetical protein
MVSFASNPRLSDLLVRGPSRVRSIFPRRRAPRAGGALKRRILNLVVGEVRGMHRQRAERKRIVFVTFIV